MWYLIEQMVHRNPFGVFIPPQGHRESRRILPGPGFAPVFRTEDTEYGGNRLANKSARLS